MHWLNRVGMLLEFLSFWFAAPEIVTEIRDDDGEWLRALERTIEQAVRGVTSPTVQQVPWRILFLVTVPIMALAIEGVLGSFGSDLVVSDSSKLEALKWTVGGMLALTLVGVAFPSAKRKTTIPDVLIVTFIVTFIAWFALEAWQAGTWVWEALLAAPLLAMEIRLEVDQPSRASRWIGMAAAVTVYLVWLAQTASPGMKFVTALVITAMWVGVMPRVAPILLRTLADDKQIRLRWLKIGVGMLVVGFLLQLIATF